MWHLRRSRFAISDSHLMLHERPQRPFCYPSPEHLSGSSLSRLPRHSHWVSGGSGSQAGGGRRQQLTCEAGCEKITTGHVFDGHSRLALQKAGHKLRLELLSGSWERRTPSSTHGRSLVERSHGRAGLENPDEPFPTGLSAFPKPWLVCSPGGGSARSVSKQKCLFHRNHTSKAPQPLLPQLPCHSPPRG